MRIRLYAAILILAAAILPLLAFGYFSIAESKSTTIREARQANALLADSAAKRIAEHLRYESAQLVTAGLAMVQMPQEPAARIAESYLITFPHWHNLTVVDTQNVTWAKGPSVGYERPTVNARPAIAGTPSYSQIREASAESGGPFAHSMSVALPLYVVGSLRGAVLADIDLVSIWAPINDIRVGKRGFVRLVTADGTVLAHGHPPDRRDVFAGQKRPDLLERARRGEDIVNGLGETAITALSPVEGTSWSVIVERPVSEAYAGARSMQRHLILLIVVTALSAILIGLWAGRRLVRSLESMEAHTKILAEGDLDHAVVVQSRIREVESLATSINTMATSLSTLHRDARAKERITTFGRVAASLAHDLRQPIETMQVASNQLLEDPVDERVWDFFRWATENELPRLQRYLDDMQHLASDGDVGLHLSTVNLAQLTSGLVEALTALPKWQGVTFLAKGSAKDIEADERLLSRAIYNLAANGADATLQGGRGIVTIEVDDVNSPTGSVLKVCVIDNGCGMSKDHLAHVLESDFESTKRASGVGLGFGVARHVVHSHGGTIECSSQEGTGTKFTLFIPRTRSFAELAGFDRTREGKS